MYQLFYPWETLMRHPLALKTNYKSNFIEFSSTKPILNYNVFRIVLDKKTLKNAKTFFSIFFSRKAQINSKHLKYYTEKSTITVYIQYFMPVLIERTVNSILLSGLLLLMKIFMSDQSFFFTICMLKYCSILYNVCEKYIVS